MRDSGFHRENIFWFILRVYRTRMSMGSFELRVVVQGEKSILGNRLSLSFSLTGLIE